MITSCAPNFALSAPGSAPTAPPPTAAGDDVHGQRRDRREPFRQHESDERRGESARGELALGADVEQAGAQSHRHGESGERERRRLVEHLAEAVRVAPCALEQQAIHRARVLPEHQDQRVADDGGDEQRHDGGKHGFFDVRAQRRSSRRSHSRHAALAPAAPVMCRPSTSDARLGARHHSDEPAAVHHRDAIGERENLRQVGRDEENRFPRIARFAQASVNQLDRADVHTASRLCGEQHLKRALHFARDDDLLLVAAGQRAHGAGRIGGADVERFDLLRRVDANLVLVQAHAARETVLLAEDEILGHAVVEHESARVTVLGNVRETRVAAHLHGRVRHVAAGDVHGSAARPVASRRSLRSAPSARCLRRRRCRGSRPARRRT